MADTDRSFDHPSSDRPCARDRNRDSRRVLLAALGLSALLHLGVLALNPPVAIGTGEVGLQSTRLQVVEPAQEVRPPAVEVPEVAVRIPPPARPVVSGTPTPETEEGPRFIPHDVPPKLINAQEVRDYLAAYYPPELRATGIEGNVMLWLYVNESGEVTKLRVGDTSGSSAFDALAESAARLMRFRPALSADRTVGVWVAQPLTFRLLDAAADEEIASR